MSLPPLFWAACALAAPLVLGLLAYDIRWIARAVKSGRRPPWGAPLRILAAVFCHMGLFILAGHAGDWPEAKLKFWLHMTLDPGLTFYALGLWDLTRRLTGGGRPARS